MEVSERELQIDHRVPFEVDGEPDLEPENFMLLCGSANKARSLRNPWNYQERKKFISESFGSNALSRLYIEPLEDYPDDGTWISSIEEKVKEITKGSEKCKVGIVGYHKDQTSYYLKSFPQWQQVKIDNFNGINATHIREMFFSDKNEQHIANSIQNLVPKNVSLFLLDFLKSKKRP